MTNIQSHKEMSVVLVVCSSQPTTATKQTTEAIPITQSIPPASAEDSPTSFTHNLPQGQWLDAPAYRQGLEHIAHEILVRGGYSNVEVGYCINGYPSVEEAIEHAVARGARRIVVVPMLLSVPRFSPCEYCPGPSSKEPQQRVSQIQARHPGVDIVYASSPFDIQSQIDLILDRIRSYEPATFKEGVLHLNELATGELGVVRQLDGGAHFRSHMASLGFTPGAVVKMLRNYGHGAVIVSLRGARVALGRGEARKVGVTRQFSQGQPGF